MPLRTVVPRRYPPDNYVRFFHKAELKLRALRARLAPLFYSGTAVWCPVCDRTARRFRPAGRGARRREQAACPYCRAKERDRCRAVRLNGPSVAHEPPLWWWPDWHLRAGDVLDAVRESHRTLGRA